MAVTRYFILMLSFTAIIAAVYGTEKQVDVKKSV